MKTKLILLLLLCWAGIAQGQEETAKQKHEDIKEYLEKYLKKNNISDDVYNPINFTEITERMPSENGKVKRVIWKSWSSVSYIKNGSNIHIAFKKEFIDKLEDECDITILAYLQRKDKTIKPLTVSGYSRVESESNNVETLKQNALDISSGTNVGYTYTVTKENSLQPSYSGEIKLAEEEIDEEDKIILHIENSARNNSGFTHSFIYEDFGGKQGPTGGFSFDKIAKREFSEFSPAASSGYSFRYQPRKSSSFLSHFLSPSFGHMLHVFQNGDNTTIGAGGSLSLFYNMVSVGFGGTINGVNHGKPYFSLGLNFIESYNTLTGLVNN